MKKARNPVGTVESSPGFFATSRYVPPPEMIAEINRAYGVQVDAKPTLFTGQANPAANEDQWQFPRLPNKKVKTWSQQFIESPEWLALRKEFLETAEKVCVKCGATENLQVDHIKPKSKYRELALEITNLQVLCWPCNRRKAAREQ